MERKKEAGREEGIEEERKKEKGKKKEEWKQVDRRGFSSTVDPGTTGV